MKKLCFGIVGCGNVSKIHAESIVNLPNSKLVAVVSRTESNARKLAKEYNCDYHINLDSFLKRKDIDVVVILTPNGLHADIGIKAARFGKHVVVEKPIDIDLKKADELISECEKNGVKLSVISQRRFSDAVQVVKKYINKGELGKLNFGNALVKWYRTQEYYDSGAWRGTWEFEGGGALINQSIHYVDLLQYLVGPVDEVFAYMATRCHNIEVEDILVGALKFKNGALGLVEANTTAYPGFEARVDIYGDNGSAIIVDDELDKLMIKGKKKISSTRNQKSLTGASNPQISFELHKRQYQDIVDSIMNNRKPSVDGIAGRNTLAVILALYESAKAGKTVKVNLI
ncbi:MAG: UDP-N-acetyl-2-amino-2-deoxyglucuronate dehydrogenase [Thermotogaceae bacterium]|nr:UDP-N-acetyl-2-amino-2-deoxyglucuronate dehydrogenase [Thermotogaceae bacterium]